MSLFNLPAINDEGIVEYFPRYFSPTQDLYSIFMEKCKFQQNQIIMWGKAHDVPRLEAWYGTEAYSYSGLRLNPHPFFPELLILKEQVEELLEVKFNSCLVNLYKSGDHYVGWHSDDEQELGERPIIASISLGSTRKFVVRKKSDHKIKKEFFLCDGDLLVMKEEFQDKWEHTIPKMSTVREGRINITFRVITKGI